MITVRSYTLYFTIEWTDTSFAQLEQVKEFLQRNAVYAQPRIYVQKGKYTFYSLQIAFQDSILRLARSLRRYSFKKRKELDAVIAYLENRISGDQVIQVFNEAVSAGTRAGIIRTASLPYLKNEGIHVARVEGGKKSGAKRRILTPEQVAQVKLGRSIFHKTLRELAEEHGVSVHAITRALRVK